MYVRNGFELRELDFKDMAGHLHIRGVKRRILMADHSYHDYTVVYCDGMFKKQRIHSVTVAFCRPHYG